MSNSTFSGNSATSGGGGIDSATASIWQPRVVTVSNSTFSGNSATNGSGGGISDGGTLTVSNSTFSGNSANTRRRHLQLGC